MNYGIAQLNFVLFFFLFATVFSLAGGSAYSQVPEFELIAKGTAQRFVATIDAVDPTSREYPGGRGPDQLILYTPKFGAYTGTNQWGTEITVRKGIVTKVGGNNSFIPMDGFVLSGHGKAKEFLQSSAIVGAKVRIKENTVYIVIDAESKVYNVNDKYQRVETILKEAKLTHSISKSDVRSCLNYLKKASKQIKSAQRALKKNQEKLALDYVNLATELVDKAHYLTYSSRSVEARGAWYRLKEKNPSELIKTLDKLKAGNFNIILPETWYHGYTIYPSAVVKQNPQFSGWDPLSVLVEEAHKRNIEVHLWVENFFVGVYEEPEIIKNHPSWAAYNRAGKIPSETEKGYYYLCPANPTTRKLVLDLYKEMVTKYNIDGIQLDYIRYPRPDNPLDEYCYCSYCRTAFKKEYGVDPINIDPERDLSLKQNWDNWRLEKITSFVKEVSAELRKIKPELILSAAIWTPIEKAKTEIQQDWQFWVEKGYLDYLSPMLYSDDIDWVSRSAKEVKNICDNAVYLYPGIAPFLKLKPETILEQVNAIREITGDGIFMFSLEQITDDLINILNSSVYREPAIPPHTYYRNRKGR